MVRLPVPAAAWVVGELAAEKGKPVLAIVPREADALSWLAGAALFAPDDREGEAVFFPAPSLTPYQEAAASLNVRAQEVVALDRILSGRATTVVTTPRALFRRLPTREAFERSVLEIRPEEDHPLEELAEHLITWGYRRTDLVAEVGDFAVRGGILDVFPPGGAAPVPHAGSGASGKTAGPATAPSEGPVRIELFGDTVDTMRRFDPATQRSEERLDSLRLLPLLLYPGGPSDARRLADLLASLHGYDGDGRRDPDARRLDPEVPQLLEDLRTGSEVPGWENYLPLLADETAGLDDFLPDALTVAVDPPSLAAEAEHHADRLLSDYQARLETGRLAVPPEALEHPPDRASLPIEWAEIRLRDLVMSPVRSEGSDADEVAEPVDFRATTTDLFHGQLPRFPQEAEANRARGDRTLVVVDGERMDGLAELLEGRGVTVARGGSGGASGARSEVGAVELIPGELERGFRLPSAGVAVYGEYQLLPRSAPAPPAARSDPATAPSSPASGTCGSATTSSTPTTASASSWRSATSRATVRAPAPPCRPPSPARVGRTTARSR